MSAGDGEVASSGGTAQVAAEHGDPVADLLDLKEPVGGDQVCKIVVAAFFVCAQLLGNAGDGVHHHGGPDKAGADGVDQDVVLGQFVAPDSGEVGDGGFGGGVGAVSLCGQKGLRGRGVDNAPPAGLLHVGHGVLGADDHAVDVDVRIPHQEIVHDDLDDAADDHGEDG